MSEPRDHDLVIVGGGMVGASLALALRGQGMRIALIEAHVPDADTQPSYDDRAIALAYGTRRIFEAIGVWPQLAGLTEAIREIHVSDRGHIGQTRLRAVDEVEVIAPAQVIGFGDDGDRVHIEVEQQGVMTTLHAPLLVAADGARSTIRERLDVPTRRWSYAQSAVVANISPSQPHRNVAYERFTDQGPVALLPMQGQRCALVWTVSNDALEATLALDDAAFLAAFQERFGHRLGRFTRVGRRAAYPLSLLRVLESVRGRVAIIGNAAHTLHPIAGQGFNLGIRDVAAIAEVIVDAHRAGDDIGADAVLRRYEQWRHGEQRGVALATDGLARLFSNPLRALKVGRNLGLLAMECLPGAKHPLARAAMGQGGRQPRLARGVPLD